LPALIPEFVYDMVYERQEVARRSFLSELGRGAGGGIPALPA
jgi:hypothetical protein